jgi:lysylphosphatidylglycerol synthetase-like protein (DUF2156 family)
VGGIPPTMAARRSEMECKKFSVIEQIRVLLIIVSYITFVLSIAVFGCKITVSVANYFNTSTILLTMLVSLIVCGICILFDTSLIKKFLDKF